jgi:hypothetical protein
MTRRNALKTNIWSCSWHLIPLRGSRPRNKAACWVDRYASTPQNLHRILRPAATLDLNPVLWHLARLFFCHVGVVCVWFRFRRRCPLSLLEPPVVHFLVVQSVCHCIFCVSQVSLCDCELDSIMAVTSDRSKSPSPALLDIEESLLKAARSNDVVLLTDILNARRTGQIVLNLNCKGGYPKTVLQTLDFVPVYSMMPGFFSFSAHFVTKIVPHQFDSLFRCAVHIWVTLKAWNWRCSSHIRLASIQYYLICEVVT